jgi:hypothetical protein
MFGRDRRLFGLGLGRYGWSGRGAMGTHSKAQLILEDILDTNEFFWRHTCMKEADETKGGRDGCEGEVRGVEEKSEEEIQHQIEADQHAREHFTP